MRRYAYIAMVVLLLALLAGCHGGGQNAVETPDSAEVSDSLPLPDTAGVSDSATPSPSVTLPDISQAPDLPTASSNTEASVSPAVSDTTETPVSPAVSDTTETHASPAVPDTTGTPVSPAVPDTTGTPVSPAVPDTTGTPVSPAVPDTTETPVSPTVSDIAGASGSGATGARTLTADELRTWSQFLCRADCNGFLMSSYSTPLQADLLFVFYTGAGVGENPSEEMVTDYLQANDLDEAYTDITFIPYDKANQVLERRTGYTLEHFKLAGNDIPMYYSQKYEGYFHMAGDTNYMPVECVSGRENPDGSLSLEVRESSDWSGDSACSFETTLKPDTTGQTMLFDKNTVTGGWLTWEDE